MDGYICQIDGYTLGCGLQYVGWRLIVRKIKRWTRHYQFLHMVAYYIYILNKPPCLMMYRKVVRVCNLRLYFLGVCKVEQLSQHRYDTLHLDKTYDASGHLDLHSINCYDSASRLYLSPLLRFLILWPHVNKLLTTESNTPLML